MSKQSVNFYSIFRANAHLKLCGKFQVFPGARHKFFGELGVDLAVFELFWSISRRARKKEGEGDAGTFGKEGGGEEFQDKRETDERSYR